jgi:hypothetical protein
VATVAFYKALHLVDALLAHDFGEHGRNHKRRQRTLKEHPPYRQIYDHYRVLKDASEIARYLGNQDGVTFDAYLSDEEVRRVLLGYRLDRLEKSLRKMLRRRAPRPRK